MRYEEFERLYAVEEQLWWFRGMEQISGVLLDQALRDQVQHSGAGDQRELAILDAGCGTGAMLNWLKRYAGSRPVLGIDLFSDALMFCKRRNAGLLTQASTTELPFADAQFDLVTSFDILVQLPEAGDPLKALQEIYRTLCPGGVVFVRAAAYSWMRSAHDEMASSYRRYTLTSLAETVSKAGFEITRATYANTFLFPVAVIFRLVLRPLGAYSGDSDVRPLPKSLAWLNPIFLGLLRFESWLLKVTGRFSLPFGLSAIIIARKPRISKAVDR